jgi:hypothetical protein
MNSTTALTSDITTQHDDDTATHVAKRARHHVHYEPLNGEQIEQLKRRLNALLFVPHGEIDDTRYEKLYSLLLRYIESGAVVLAQFVQLGGIEIVCQAARHPHLELRAVAIRLVGAVGATVFMNDWPTCMHVTLAELSATTPDDPLVLDAVLRAWSSLAANDAITWSEDRSRDLVALVSHAWQYATHFVASSAVKLLHRLIVHERVIPQHVVDEVKRQVTWQCNHLSEDFKLIHAVLDLFAALVEQVQGRAVLARDQLLYDTVTRVIACPQLFTDSHANTRLLELIDAVTRVNHHALFGNDSSEISAEEQFVAWLELFLAPLSDVSRDIHSKEFEFAVRLLSHVNFPSNSRGTQWHAQQCRRFYSHVIGSDQHHLTFLICGNLIHHARKEQLQLLEHAELWEYLHNYLNDHVIECQSRALKLIEKNKRMILQLISVLALKPNIDMSIHATAVLSYLTGQSRDTVALPVHVPLVCNSVQCLTLVMSRAGFDLTGVTTNTLIATCQLGLLHRTWEIRETFLRFVAKLMCHSRVIASLKHVIAEKFSDPEPFVVVAALQVFQDMTRDQWPEWHDHVIRALPDCLRHEDSVVRVTAWQVMASWHQSLGLLFLERCRTEPTMTLQQHVTAACQDDDWEVRQSALEWCHALIAHVHWPHVFELDADSLLHHATTDPIRLVRVSAYRALHALFKQLHDTPVTHTRAAALLQELRTTDWARVMADQEPHAVYHEDDDVFPLEPDLLAQDTNQLDCPF